LDDYSVNLFLTLSPINTSNLSNSYEVDREKLIGFGFFSDVYRGTWNGRTVAIKVLANTTPRELFKHEVAIWAKLQHPHVLRLCGASSAAGDPPWFFVAPYQQNGNLAQYLQRIEAGWSATTSEKTNASNFGDRGRPRESLTIGGFPRSSPSRSHTPKFPVRGSPKWILAQGRPLEDKQSVSKATREPVPREWDIYRFIHEIAKGMAYLHENEVFHGDLKVRFHRLPLYTRLTVAFT
jgi:serine/threonine protein kinase